MVFRRRFALLPFLLVFTLLFTSCAQFDIQVPVTNNPSTSPPTPGSNYSGTHTTTSFFWGLITDGGIKTTDCTEAGMQEVTVSRDAFQQILSILTLGIVSPMNVRWKCQAAPARKGRITRADGGMKVALDAP